MFSNRTKHWLFLSRSSRSSSLKKSVCENVGRANCQSIEIVMCLSLVVFFSVVQSCHATHVLSLSYPCFLLVAFFLHCMFVGFFVLFCGCPFESGLSANLW